MTVKTQALDELLYSLKCVHREYGLYTILEICYINERNYCCKFFIPFCDKIPVIRYNITYRVQSYPR